jgi:hypothetical protein
MLPNKRESESHDTGACKQSFGNWSAYATAAGAALAMSTNASASIISSTPDLIVSSTTNDLAHFSAAGGGALLVDESFIRSSSPPNAISLTFRRRAVTAVIIPGLFGQTSTSHHRLRFGISQTHVGESHAKRYSAGQPILASHMASVAGIEERNSTLLQFSGGVPRPDGSHDQGNFGAGFSNGFVGFENAAGDLGWMHFQVTLDIRGFPIQLELISLAYNDVAGAPIDAAQTTETPEPGSAALSLLALGAAGILALRKRRSQPGKITQG